MEIDGAFKPIGDQINGNQGKRPAQLNLSKTGSKRGIKRFPGPFCKRMPCSAALTILLSNSTICFYLFSRCLVLGFYRFRIVIWAVYPFLCVIELLWYSYVIPFNCPFVSWQLSVRFLLVFCSMCIVFLSTVFDWLSIRVLTVVY